MKQASEKPEQKVLMRFPACTHNYQRRQLWQEGKNCQELEKGFWAVLKRTPKLFDLKAIYDSHIGFN